MPARPSCRAIITPPACSPTRSAAACRRACSSSCARSAGLAYTVYASLYPYRDVGLFSIYAATARRQCAASAQLIEDIVAAAAETIVQREVDRVRTQARAGLLMSMESPWGQAHYVARQLSLYGRLVDHKEVIKDLDAVTVDHVRAAGASMLASPRARATIGFPAVRAA